MIGMLQTDIGYKFDPINTSQHFLNYKTGYEKSNLCTWYSCNSCLL